MDVSDVTPDVNASVFLPGRAPLVRCYDGQYHFMTNSSVCPPSLTGIVSGRGTTAVDEALGCVAVLRDSNMARALRSCRSVSGATNQALQFSKKPRASSAANSTRHFLGTLAPRVAVVPVLPTQPPVHYPMPTAGVHYHVLDGMCDIGDTDLGVLGYVR